MSDLQLALTFAGSAAAFLAAWVGYLRKVKPALASLNRVVRQITTLLDLLAGRPAQEDPLTGRTTPAVPALHNRVITLEQAAKDAGEALLLLTKDRTDLHDLRRIAQDHEARIITLEEVDAERARTTEESAAMWRAIADKDVIDVPTSEE